MGSKKSKKKTSKSNSTGNNGQLASLTLSESENAQPEVAETEDLATNGQAPEQVAIDEALEPERAESSPPEPVESTIEDEDLGENQNRVEEPQFDSNNEQDQPKPNVPNGSKSDPNEGGKESSSSGEVYILRRRLAEAESERDEAQDAYDSLVEKLTYVKTNLSERLKKDAEAVAKLTDQNVLLQKELELVRSDQQRAIDAMRLKHQQELAEQHSLSETMEMELAKVQSDLAAETTESHRYKDLCEILELRLAQTTDQKATAIAELEKELGNQHLLLKDTKSELYESRRQAAQADIQAAKSAEFQARNVELESSVREKNLLIGKLRHEAVILNDHLTNALRLVKKDAEGQTVDKELISNLLVQYATVPRQDTKKFEILQLIANFLGWDEERRAQVGLSRLSRSVGPNESGIGGVLGKFAEFLERESKKS